MYQSTKKRVPSNLVPRAFPLEIANLVAMAFSLIKGKKALGTRLHSIPDYSSKTIQALKVLPKPWKHFLCTDALCS